MNQVVEMIEIRIKKRDIQHIEKLKTMIMQMQNNNQQLLDINFLTNQFISGNFCIILIWDRIDDLSKASSVANLIIDYLKPKFLVNHSIWKKEY